MKMLNARHAVGVLAIAGTSLFTANAANAACYAGWVNVAEVVEYNINGTPYSYIYAVPQHAGPLPSYSYYFYSTNQFAMIQAKMALQNHESLYLTGDASTCPTSGSYRYGGTLLHLYDY